MIIYSMGRFSGSDKNPLINISRYPYLESISSHLITTTTSDARNSSSSSLIINNMPLICVTGFGPFANHETKNASWEAVRLLPQEICISNRMFTIQKLEIPVVYKDVDNIVPEIWKNKPSLVVHCGVYGKTIPPYDKQNILLEKCAYNKGFCSPDWLGECLPCDKINLSSKEKCCSSSENDIMSLNTELNVDKIVNELNNDSVSLNNCAFAASTNVGSYLCGYTYLKSLDCDTNRTIFIHVPPVDCPYSSETTSQAILAITNKCITQLINDNKCDNNH